MDCEGSCKKIMVCSDPASGSCHILSFRSVLHLILIVWSRKHIFKTSVQVIHAWGWSDLFTSTMSVRKLPNIWTSRFIKKMRLPNTNLTKLIDASARWMSSRAWQWPGQSSPASRKRLCPRCQPTTPEKKNKFGALRWNYAMQLAKWMPASK